MIPRCRVHPLPGPVAAINHSKPGRAGHTPGPCLNSGFDTKSASLGTAAAVRRTVSFTQVSSGRYSSRSINARPGPQA
jgi:hypothetical protein